MRKKLMQQVIHSLFKVMETMFSPMAEKQKTTKVPSQAQPDPEEMKACRITFSGSFSGTIFLEISVNLLTAMTQNFPGRDPGHPSEELIEGLLKEALNIIAGDTLTQMDAASYTQLGLPEIVTSPCCDDMDETARFDTPNGSIAAHIKLA
ncbi:MAG: chemotaxis protein CheX [Proteobacteria bacterium]|nr:chemotaxis protein CheX [Pseudomonadota bacterium]MBU4130274.1 chemotaxis protein CheX [Pseudomonadota bacterium]